MIAYFSKLNKSGKLPAAMVAAVNERKIYEAAEGSDEDATSFNADSSASELDY